MEECKMSIDEKDVNTDNAKDLLEDAIEIHASEDFEEDEKSQKSDEKKPPQTKPIQSMMDLRPEVVLNRRKNRQHPRPLHHLLQRVEFFCAPGSIATAPCSFSARLRLVNTAAFTTDAPRG